MWHATAIRLSTQDELWAKGCSKIYLDVGSNVGVQIRKLFEPSKYSDAPVLPVFEKLFGGADHRTKPSSETGLCAIGFEANPQLVPRLREIESAYNEQGWKVKIMAPFAVSDTDDGEVTFHVYPATNGVGSSIVNRGRRGPHNKNVTVGTLSLAAFLEKEVFPVSPEKVLMKMDIEGSEYIVLPDLIRREYLCDHLINEMFIEWHEKKMHWPGMPSTRQVQEDLLKQKCKSSKTTLNSLDDETYIMDGQPLPGSLKSLPSKIEVDVSAGDIYAAVQEKWRTAPRSE
jgi:FkbM family methyltransferase